jgi:hypothetical protein
MLRPTRQRLRFTRGGGGAVSAFIVSLSQTTVSESEDPGVLIATITSNRSGSTFELIAITGSDPNEPKFSITGTGLYLDQADNYALVAQHAQGQRVLDCFSNQGGFALACAKAGASEVTALDISADACAAIEANAQRNNVRLNVTETNVFDWLKSATSRGDQYDLIILDPPSFTRDRARLNDALRGYKEIHLRAAQLLGNGGLLATFCCSHHVSDARTHSPFSAMTMALPASMARVRASSAVTGCRPGRWLRRARSRGRRTPRHRAPRSPARSAHGPRHCQP